MTYQFARASRHWLAPGLVAFPAASIGWFLGGDLRLEVGVAAVACVLAGWSGYAGAMIGAALADYLLAEDPAQATIVVCTTAVAACVSGIALRRAFAQPTRIDVADPAAPVLSAGFGALVAAIALFAYGASALDALRLLGSLWAGGLLMTPLLLEVLASKHERSASRRLAVVAAAIVFAIVTYVATPLLVRVESAGLIGVAVVFAIAAVAASRAQLALALALGALAGIVASALPSLDQIGVTCGILIGITLLLAIGLADRHVDRFGAAEAAGRQLFDATMRLLPLGIIRIGVDGTMRYANPMFQTITGLTAVNCARQLARDDSRR